MISVNTCWQLAAFQQGVAAGFGDFAFGLVLPVDGAAILRADVAELAVLHRRVDMAPEVIDQLLIAHLRRIVAYADGLGMPGAAGADLRGRWDLRSCRRCIRTPSRSHPAACRNPLPGTRNSRRRKWPSRGSRACPRALPAARRRRSRYCQAAATRLVRDRLNPRRVFMSAAPAACRRAARIAARHRCCSSACRSVSGRHRKYVPDARRNACSGTRCADRST